MHRMQSEARVSRSRCQEAGPLRKLQGRALPASPSFRGSRHPRAVDTSPQPLLPSPCGPSRISSRMDGSHWLRAQPLRRGLAQTAAGGGLGVPGPLGSSCLHTCLLFHLGSGNMRGGHLIPHLCHFLCCSKEGGSPPSRALAFLCGSHLARAGRAASSCLPAQAGVWLLQAPLARRAEWVGPVRAGHRLSLTAGFLGQPLRCRGSWKPVVGGLPQNGVVDRGAVPAS